MRTATTYIAESIVKAVGVAGIEAMAMKNAIYSVWEPLAEEFANEVILECIHFDEGDTRPEYADAVIQQYRTRMTSDFVEEVLPYVEEYAGNAWDRGREDAFEQALSGLLGVQKNAAGVRDHEYDNYVRLSIGFMGRREMPEEVTEYKLQKDQESIITDLVSLTGSTKANVQRTIKRWFETTQGQYFDRFIVPETARLLSYEEGSSLRAIGKNYKKFVKADGYWSSVSEFNSETSKVFAQVQALHEMNVHTYTIEAIIDEKTCEVCLFLNGSTWSVQEAVTKMYDMLVMEADEAYTQNPFPGRSAPKDFDQPTDSPYNLPPYHPRCRCNVRSEHAVTAMPQQVLARPFEAGPRPTDKLLNKVFTQYINRATTAELKGVAGARALTTAEWKIARAAWDDMPLEVKKWASRNKENFNMYIRTGDDVTSRVIGNNIEMNAKFFNPEKYGPQPLQHELRHALVNKEVVNSRGANTIWDELSAAAEDTRAGFRSPTHVNTMYQLNGNRGLQAASAASDEFLAMVGDYYKPNMSMSELISEVTNKSYGINVSDKLGSTLVSANARWSAREAKSAVAYWWEVMDIDNNTLLSKKQLLAKKSYSPFTLDMRKTAINNEVKLRDALRVSGVKSVHQTGDNAPFDVWIGADPAKYYSGASRKKPTALIEVKTIVTSTNNKITMRKAALERKREEIKKLSKKDTRVYTIVVDERTGKYYIKDDIGSFRLATMDEVTLDELQVILGGKPMITELPPQGVPEKYKAVYKKQTTTAKATAEIKKKFGVVVDWPTTGEFAAFPAKAKVRLLNEIGEELGYLNNDRGLYIRWTVPEGGDRYITKTDFEKISLVNDWGLENAGVPGLQSETAIGCYDYANKTLYVSVLDDAEDMAGTSMRRRELIVGGKTVKASPHTVGGDESISIFEHEVGHALHFALDEVEYPNINYWLEWSNIYDSESTDWWAKNLSRYGSTNSYEAFAESFATYMHPDYGKKFKLPKKVEEYFAEILGAQTER